MPEIIEKQNEFLREKYYSFTHSSGLPVYVFPKKLSTTYAIFATRYGSIDNCFKLAGDAEFTRVPDGIAHYLEHKLFENPNGEDTFTRFARCGANANAYTSNTMTAYLFSCTEHFAESLEILLDFVTTPYFTPETVEKEQGIIAQEIKMYDDHPFRRLYQMMLEGMYERHNVRINVAGTVESISHITDKLLYDCYRVFYNLSNMMLIVCGDVEVDEIDKICTKVLKPSEPIEIIRENPREPASVFKPLSERAMQVAKPLFGIGIKDTSIPSDPRERMKKNAAHSILNNVLFGKSGEFYNKLYVEGLLSGQFDFGYEINQSFAFNALFGESSDPDKVYERFLECVANAACDGIDREDFERSRRAMYASMVKCFDSTEEIANYFLAFRVDDCDLLDYVDIIANISWDDVMNTLREVYLPDRYTLSIVKPLE